MFVYILFNQNVTSMINVCSHLTKLNRTCLRRQLFFLPLLSREKEWKKWKKIGLCTFVTRVSKLYRQFWNIDFYNPFLKKICKLCKQHRCLNRHRCINHEYFLSLLLLHKPFSEQQKQKIVFISYLLFLQVTEKMRLS